MSEKPEEPVVRFTKTQILASKTYADTRDLLTALLKDGHSYSYDEINKLTEKWKKGKVV